MRVVSVDVSQKGGHDCRHSRAQVLRGEAVEMTGISYKRKLGSLKRLSRNKIFLPLAPIRYLGGSKIREEDGACFLADLPSSL